MRGGIVFDRPQDELALQGLQDLTKGEFADRSDAHEDLARIAVSKARDAIEIGHAKPELDSAPVQRRNEGLIIGDRRARSFESASVPDFEHGARERGIDHAEGSYSRSESSGNSKAKN